MSHTEDSAFSQGSQQLQDAWAPPIGFLTPEQKPQKLQPSFARRNRQRERKRERRREREREEERERKGEKEGERIKNFRLLFTFSWFLVLQGI